MLKKLPTVLIFLLMVSVPGSFAQVFNPTNNTAYPVEFIEWIVNGEDKLPVMQSLLRSCAITFYLDNTVVSLGNTFYKANYTFFQDGSCEISIKTIIIRRTVLGQGTIELSGRDLALSLSMSMGGQNVNAIIKGKIK